MAGLRARALPTRRLALNNGSGSRKLRDRWQSIEDDAERRAGNAVQDIVQDIS